LHRKKGKRKSRREGVNKRGKGKKGEWKMRTQGNERRVLAIIDMGWELARRNGNVWK